MVSPLHQFSLTQLLIAAVLVVVVLAMVQRWALRRLNADPDDDLEGSGDDKDAEILGDVPVRSKVGTPRPRRLQPARAGESEPVLASSLAGAETAAPAAALAAGTTRKTDAERTAPSKPLEVGGLPQPALASTGSGKPGAPADLPVPVGGIKTPELVKAAVDKPAEPVALPPLTVNLPPLSTDKPVDKPAVPVAEKVADGLVAVGQPGATAPASPTDLDDVKKRKNPPTSPAGEQTRPGLILIPKGDTVKAEPVTASTASPAKPPVEPVKPVEKPAEKLVVADKKEEAPAAKPAEPVVPATPAPVAPATPEKKVEPPVKSGWRPRIFLPANLPAKDKPAEAPKPAVAETKPPVPEIPAKVESKETAPAAAAKPEPKPEVKPETAPAPVPTLPASKPAEPVAAKTETPAPAKEPAKIEPVPVPAIKAEEKKPEPAKAEPAKTAPAQSVPASDIKVTLPESRPAAGSPPKAPETSAPTPVPVPTLPSQPAPAAPAPAVSVSTPQPTMAQNESTTNVPANSRAAAQLTLGFEITSLQLTPFFKLGGVQLKPLSNVVGLHLIASQAADNPLAAGISFQIDTVELNEASHVKSILLKPLQGGVQPAAVPQSKVQVDAVQISSGSEGAPISVTSSAGAATAVQLLATFSIAAMDFTPSFEIGSLRLEPTSNSVLLRLAPSSRPAALDLPPSFEVDNVSLGDNAQISGMKLTPGNKPS